VEVLVCALLLFFSGQQEESYPAQPTQKHAFSFFCIFNHAIEHSGFGGFVLFQDETQRFSKG
jgi:hypothetical protein